MSETILIGAAVALVLILFGRELACWYWKINKHISLMEEQTKLLREIRDAARTEGVLSYKNGADQGDADAQTKKAADQGDADAQFNLGLAYGLGRGVPQDHAEAARWFRKAADQGHAEAQTHLGLAYDSGKGVPKDHAEAMRWYKKAADQGTAQ